MSVNGRLKQENIAMAREMRARGCLVSQIAQELGVAPSTASMWLNDPTGEKQRARKDSYRGTCVSCGAATDGSNGRAKAPKYCNKCYPQSPEHIAAVTKWPQSRIVAAIRWWADEYGSPPAMSDWNPYQARRQMHDEDRAVRAETLIRNGAVPWFNTVVQHFGSWNAGMEAAGFDPRAPHGGDGNMERRRGYSATHCLHGHPFDEQNTYIWGGARHCRACGRRRSAEYQIRKRAEQKAAA